MKKIIILFVLVAIGCKSSSNDPSPVDEMKSILTSGPWQLQSVTVDNVDRTNTYSGLTLTFSATGFTTTNGRVIWPASGTWQFADDTGKNITRSDAIAISVGEATANKLVMSFTWSKTTLGPGRVSSLQGNHVFTFGK